MGVTVRAAGVSIQRIGHTTLVPRHSIAAGDPADDKGMYAGFIDPAHGYAYFVGNYLFKLDITGPEPVQVGPALFTGQFLEGAIDPAAGYLYLAKGASLFRYALGAGMNPVSSAGSPLVFTEGASPAISIVVDDSDPDPANHYGYVLCSGTPAKVVKVALSTFTEVSSVALNAGENAFAWGRIDVQRGYAYFATYATFNAPVIPQVVKIKLTPGSKAPVRVGTVDLGPDPVPLWTCSIDTVNGYIYYATDNGTTNVPETVFKVKLGDGDALPAPVPFGGVSLRTNEVQLISQVVDPVGGYVYFGDDNTYPAKIFQFSLNGTNPPVELGCLQLEGGTSSTNPPDGTTTSNTTTNMDGLLPYGEVMLRSAVFDPVRGYAYFGQDSRPNQVVKVRLAQPQIPFSLQATQAPGAGSFRFNFSNQAGAAFSAWSATNLTQPAAEWTMLGHVTEISPGQFQFTDLNSSNDACRFYRVSSP